MANNVNRVLDDSELLPEGLVYTPAKKKVSNENFSYDIGDDWGDSLFFDASDDNSDSLSTPQFIRVIDQTVRTAADGRQVIDVVIETDDIPGALKYEVRVTTG